MSDLLETGLADAYDVDLAKQLLDTYREAKRNFYLGGHRLSEVEGGRFCEAAYRILQLHTSGTFTQLGGQLETDRIERDLARASTTKFPKSVRIYLPRTLRVVYDIRNSRNAAHLGDGIDAGLQDATLVVSVLDWVLAELIRLSRKFPVDEAQRLIEGIITREVPVVQEFDKVPVLLRNDLRAGEHILVLLYHRSPRPVKVDTLSAWVPATMAKNLRRTLDTLRSKTFVHLTDDSAQITYSGERHVDSRRLFDPW